MSCWAASAEALHQNNNMKKTKAKTTKTTAAVKSKTADPGAKPGAAKPHQTIKLGLDVHADTIVVVRMLDNSPPQPAQKFTPAKFRAWVKTQVGLAEAVHSCYEAGPFGFVLHRELVAMGVKNIVAQPVCLDERHTGVNHDKSDAKELAMRLDRRVAGNDHAMATVRVPTPEEEQKRIESRQREQLKREVNRLAAQGRSLLLCQGYREKSEWWKEAQWEKLADKLPEWLSKLLEVFRRILAVLTAELEAATAALAAAAPAALPKGMGGLTHQVIEREVGDWTRFKNRRQVGSYTGLCGGVSSSGASHRLLSITKHGNVRLRTALVELAWRLVLWQPQCHLVKKWDRILGNPKASRAARKKAIVAIARQLAVDMWRWRTGRVKPKDLGWTMAPA
jgi:transposase